MGTNKCRVWQSLGTGCGDRLGTALQEGPGGQWGALGPPPGPPKTGLEGAGLETGLEQPNCRRLCAGLGPNGPPKVCWLLFSWVPSVSPPLPFWGGYPRFGERRTLPSHPPGSMGASPGSRGGFAVLRAPLLGDPRVWGREGGSWQGSPLRRAARSGCPRHQPLCPPGSPGPLSQLPNLLANARMCVSPGSSHAPPPPRLPPAAPRRLSQPRCAAPRGAGSGPHGGTGRVRVHPRVSLVL